MSILLIRKPDMSLMTNTLVLLFSLFFVPDYINYNGNLFKKGH